MNTFTAVLLFAIGIVLVVKGGDWFVDAASWIARSANIPPFIIGATIVSFATTLPEMIVSVMASLEGKNDMAVGNAVGSVTANTGLIMAIAFIFMSVVATRKDYIKSCFLLLLSPVILWLGSRGGTLQLWASIVLIIIFALSMVHNVLCAKKEAETEEKIVVTGKEIAKNIALFVVGAAAIVFGSNCLINGGSSIAEALGVPERVIAITMVAIGTSLPELVTTITAIKKKQSHLSIGNIVGANIIDLTLILPICSFLSKSTFAVSPKCLNMDIPACFLICLVAVVPLMIREKASKAQGIIMVLLYAAYLVLSI